MYQPHIKNSLQQPENNDSQNSEVILVNNFDDIIDQRFINEIATSYFRDIFKDVSMRSHSPKKDELNCPLIDNVAFFEFIKLPGIICDRFFSIFERTKENFILEDAFIKTFTKVYLSSLQTKMELTY